MYTYFHVLEISTYVSVGLSNPHEFSFTVDDDSSQFTLKKVRALHGSCRCSVCFRKPFSNIYVVVAGDLPVIIICFLPLPSLLSLHSLLSYMYSLPPCHSLLISLTPHTLLSHLPHSSHSSLSSPSLLFTSLSSLSLLFTSI